MLALHQGLGRGKHCRMPGDGATAGAVAYGRKMPCLADRRRGFRRARSPGNVLPHLPDQPREQERGGPAP